MTFIPIGVGQLASLPEKDASAPFILESDLKVSGSGTNPWLRMKDKNGNYIAENSKDKDENYIGNYLKPYKLD
jgi:hypothetical protein